MKGDTRATDNPYEAWEAIGLELHMNDEHDNRETDKDVTEALDDEAAIPDILFSLITSEWDNWCAPGDEICTSDTDEPVESNNGETQAFETRSGVLVLVTVKTFLFVPRKQTS